MVAHLHQLRHPLAANLHAAITAVGEVASRGHLERIGDHAFDHVETLAVVIFQPRNGLQKAKRIRMHRIVEQRAHLSLFDHLAAIHDDDAIGGFRHDAQIVRDEQHGHAGVVAQAAQKVENLRLDGHIERRGGLVGNEKLGVARKRHGDHDALAHAARHLVRIVAHAGLRARDADLAQKVDRARERFLLGNLLVRANGLDDLVADAVHGVERRHGLLEDHGHVVAAHLAVFLLGERRQVLAVELHRAAGDVAGFGQKAHNRQARDRLARAGFAHDGEDLPFVDRERHVVDGADDAALDGELSAEVLHFKQHVTTSFSTWGQDRRGCRHRAG